MKNKKTLPAIVLCMFLMQPSFAQDFTVDMANIKAGYPADFSKDFTISFKGTATANVTMKKDDGTPAVLKKGADMASYTIKITAANGKLKLNDANQNPITIAKDKFEIDAGDKAIIVSKAKTADGIFIDVKNINEEGYSADFSKAFAVKFTNAAATSVKVAISSTDPPLSAELNTGTDLSNYTINFTPGEGNKLVVKDQNNNDVGIESSPFNILLDGKPIAISNSNITVPPPPSDKSSDGEGPKNLYWSYLKKDSLTFSLDDFRIINKDPKCCDNCAECDDDAFKYNNKIIYDARSGVTYFMKSGTNLTERLCGNDVDKYAAYMVSHSNKIKLKSGDPLVYIVENANPALYDIRLSDSSFLTNNETTALLESLLLQRSEGKPISNNTTIQGGDDTKQNEQEYLKVKTGLLMVRAEIWKLLENYRRSSPYLHNCIQAAKRKALDKIDGYPKTMLNKRYEDYTFIQLVDIFLNQETEDSTLNHEIKALYGEFVAASYKIAYRYPQVPEEDILDFRLSITAKPNSPYPGLLNVQMKHPTQTVYIKNFFKIDVSSGLYYGMMKDQAYTLQPDTVMLRNKANTEDSVVNVKRIVKEDDAKNEIGFASFLHLYYKWSGWMNLGATVGAGISFDKTVRPRYFTGASLLLGNHNRLCISGGLVWGNYSDLSNQYKKTGDSYNLLKDSETTLNNTTRFKYAGFVSVSYNLAFINRKSGNM